MQLKIFTLSFDPESGGFPNAPLSGLEGEVLGVAHHFFIHQGIPQLALLVQYRPEEEVRGRRSGRSSGRDPRSELAESERELYDRLRAWRNVRAEADGVPPYLLFTNRQIMLITRRHPASLVQLQEVPGIGQAKAGRYGKDVLAVVASSGKGAEAGPAKPAEVASGTAGEGSHV